MPKFFETLDEKYISDNFSGILVLGDVHGMIEPFEKSVQYAKENNLYIVSLGDIIDYGPHSKEVVQLAKSLKDQSKISVILGNHERKFARWIVQKSEGKIRITLKPAIQASIDSFGDDNSAINDFTNLHSDMINILKYKNVYFTHGALHNKILESPEYSPIAYQMAIFAEIDNTVPRREDGYPNRIYEWVSKLPDDIFVFIGHDIRSREEPYREKGIIWLDTGCGKEGFLSGAHLNIDGAINQFVKF